MEGMRERIEAMAAMIDDRQAELNCMADALRVLGEERIIAALSIVGQDPEMLARILGKSPECGLKELNGFAGGVIWHSAMEGVRAVLDSHPDGLCWQQIQDSLKGKFYTQSKQPQSIVANAIRTVVQKQEAIQLDPNDLYGSPYVLIQHLNGRKPKVYQRYSHSEMPQIVEDAESEEDLDGEDVEAEDGFVPLVDWCREVVRRIASCGPMKEMKLLEVVDGMPEIGVAKALRGSDWFEQESDGWHISARGRAAVMG
jgi:hypothetical protein